MGWLRWRPFRHRLVTAGASSFNGSAAGCNTSAFESLQEAEKWITNILKGGYV